MGNAKSSQDHYKVLGVDPDATETRITKAFRAEALKWHPERRTRGDIGVAYRVLTNPKKRDEYDSSRGKGNGKRIFIYMGIVVVGYVMYRLCRRGKLEEIGNCASTLKSQLAPSPSVSSVHKIGQAAMEKVDTIMNWAKVSDAASALGSKLASSAGSVQKIAMEEVDTIVNWASKVKDSDTSSALGSKLASSAGLVASASKDGLSKAAKWFQK